MPDWNIVRRLGSGAFGEVWLVVDRALGAERAVKLVRPERLHDPTDFYAEPHALVALKHTYTHTSLKSRLSFALAEFPQLEARRKASSATGSTSQLWLETLHFRRSESPEMIARCPASTV